MDESAAAPHSIARLGMRANAVMSLVTGVLLLVAAPTIGDVLAVEIDGWLRLLGVALVSHAVLLVWASRLADPTSWLRLNLLIVAPYPLLMLAVAVFLLDTAGGRSLVLVDGVLVGVLACVQYVGLRQERDGVGVEGAA